MCAEIVPPDLTAQQKRKFLHKIRNYYWDEPYLFKGCTDQLIRRCVPEAEMIEILEKCHSSPYGGHFAWQRTAAKILQLGFYWSTIFRDSKIFVQKL